MTIPVILDTDIGFDVDDVWALALLLRCPELDVRLITTCTGDVAYRAALVAKVLDVEGRTDIPIGLGVPGAELPNTHEAWLEDFRLEDYAGVALDDGVGAICQAVAENDTPTLICIGPLTNIAAALERDPGIADNARFLGMHGSIRKGYLGAPQPMREYNIVQDVSACQTVLRATWDKALTPLDTCGIVRLQDAAFARVRDSDDPLAKAVMENHWHWYHAAASVPMIAGALRHMDPEVGTSVLYDCVTIYQAFCQDALEIETLPVVVSDEGHTVIDPAGGAVECATAWQDIESFYDLLATRLSGAAV